MKIAIFGKTFSSGFRKYIMELLQILETGKAEVLLYKPFYDFICCDTCPNPYCSRVFTGQSDFEPDCDLLISIGGDGTFLESLPFAIHTGIPVIGINSGRLGFLANIAKEEISGACARIFANDYVVENRTLIEIHTKPDLFGGMGFALNDITVKSEGLITVEAYVNEEYLNTYWTDGLIISTPTGSTAYSLSVGGPIVVPGSGNLIIAPIASHNLTVRPLIIPDSGIIRIRVTSRSGRFRVTADSRWWMAESESSFSISRSEHTLRLVRLPGTSFYKTLRDKLKWGEDVRN